MDDDYELEIEGYKVIPNNRNLLGGGVLIAVRREIMHIAVEVKRTKDKFESLWILINNNRVKLRIGVVYFPQERDQDLKEIYKVIKQQVRESGEKKEAILIVGDFNSKVGSVIEGNNKVVSKGGRKLLSIIEKEGLVLGNAMEKCDGTWTRVEGKKKSILDYVIMDEDFSEHIESVKIFDNDDSMSAFNLKRKRKDIKMVYSDHKPIMIKTDLIMKQIKTEENNRRRVMTEEGREKYKKELEEREISRVWDNVEDLQETYKKWCAEVEEVKTKHEVIRKTTTKRRSKTMRLLIQEKKRVKDQMKINGQEKDMEQLKRLKEQMMEEEKETYWRKLQKNCEEIRKNGKFDSGGFWKVKKRMECKKDEAAHAVKNLKGELVTTTEEIKEAYADYFEDLLTKTNKRTELVENKDVVQRVQVKFNEIMEKARKQKPSVIGEDLMEEVVNGLKKKKAKDNEGWKNEMIIDGGKEMVASLTKMTNTVMEQYEIPEPWEHMTIKSTHKKGEKEDLNNKRGLFLTNVISKVFEKVVDKISPVKFDKNQNGGQKMRGPVDNWMLLRSLIDEGRRLKKPVYFFFADLVKCFDRLWLKDCINDLGECGMRERELGLIYKLNEKAHFKVNTPAGLTREVMVKEIVKQGTVFGPKLCCGSTGMINKGVEEEEIIFPTLSAKAVAYVDDIEGGGSKKLVQAIMMSCVEKEEEKLWEFSVDKSKWMCIDKNKKNREREIIDVEVRQGKLEKTDLYKYLGNMVNELGNMDDQLKFMEEKLPGILREGRKMCCSSRIGRYEMEGKKLIYDVLAVAAVFYNVEVWTNLRNSDKEKLKSIQGKLIRGLYGLPKTTPYWGMIYELQIMPILLLLTYKKLMLYHNLMNSDEERLGRLVVEAQEASGFDECWYGEMKREAEEIGVKVSKDKVQGKKKSSWKREVKMKIVEAMEKEIKEKQKSSRKMRFLKSAAANTYLKEIYNEDARMAMKIRLNMIEWIDGNMGKESACPLCKQEADTTEHVFVCEAMDNQSVTVGDLVEGEKMMEVVELFRRNEEQRRVIMKDHVELNFDILRQEGTL